MEVQVNNKNAVIYARYSSDSQTEQSIEGQVRVIKDYAKRNNIPIINSYIDRAISGLREDRPEFQKMVSDSKKNKFGYVLVYKYDRFSRDRLNSLLYKKELRKNGVKVISVTEYISDDPQGILFESIIDGYSEFYSAELSQKVKRGNRESRMKGLYTGGIVPYGYKIVDKKYVINEEEAVFVRKIFEDIISGKTHTDICNYLNIKGITNKGKKFLPTYISKMLRNEKYMGKVTTNGEVFDNIVPAIIDEETFITAKNKSISHHKLGYTNKAKEVRILSKKLFCGYCGKPVISDAGVGRNGQVYSYYKCTNNKFNTHNCELNTFKKDDLEQLVLDSLKSILINPELYESIAERLAEEYNSTIVEDTRVSLNEKELARNKRETENIVNVLASGIVVPAVKEKLEKLEAERQILEDERIKLSLLKKEKISSKDVIKFLTEVVAIDDDSMEYKKYLINKFVKRIDLFNDKISISINMIDDGLNENDEDKFNNGSNNNGDNGTENNNNGLVEPLKFLKVFHEHDTTVRHL